MNKEWKFIPDTNNKYLISNHGEVFSLNTFNFLKPYTRKDGYKLVKLNRKTLFIHRLVAVNFIPNNENKNTVNHKDFDRSNNKYTNLEWCTPKENIAYSKSLKRYPRGEKIKFSKLTENQVIEIRKKFEPRKYMIKQLAREYGVSLVTINQIIHRNTWKHI